MSKYIHYFLAPIFYLIVAQVGSLFTSQGVTSWYSTIMKPSFTPPGSFIGIMWTIIFILSAISLIFFVNSARGKSIFWPIIGLYILNGVFNVLWSYIFFTKHELGLAVVDALLIWITVGILIFFVWTSSRTASLLLLPYFLWVSFATYLTYVIYRMN
ncbi:MAG: tryptophan-rich sensory protein [Nitrospirota bacterium]|nr:tryptophan-rich sensory protein [Nitrospirota bacterium]MDH5768963.1 tryptophan-rich sensory protein [Nitrospirota bacterium]